MLLFFTGKSMKIGILGSGDVGRRLSDGLIEFGHTVKIGTRDPSQARVVEWITKHGEEKASAGSFAEAALFGELIVLASAWDGTSKLLMPLKWLILKIL
jgi:8-hydroxy-5-deazaflavin:NADPH oxidoreductase